GRFATFVPAPIGDVWTLVSRAERMPEWEPMTKTIEADAAGDATWIVHAPERRPDGEPMKIKPEFRRRRVAQAEALSPARVVWWFDYPDAPQTAPRMLAIELSPI